MKKAFAVALAVVMMCFSGCGVVNSAKRQSNKKSEEIVRCFDEKDVDGLKSLFCTEIQTSHNLDKEIQNAFDLYSGKSLSYDLYYGGTAGGWDNGECIDEHITPRIENLKTDTDKTYRIPYHEYVIYKANLECVGITYIRIFDEDSDKMVQIGEYIY